jgi:hypothetical protein
VRTRSVVVVACFVWTMACAAESRDETIQRAAVDSAGQLRVELSDTRVSVPAKDSDQVAFAQVAVSSDHRVVGWVNLYPNCCTSYPLPLKLVLMRASGEQTVIATDLPIWQWAFADSDRVVIREAPVHFGPAGYQLRDIRTGRLIASVEPDSLSASLPAWARRIFRRP